MRGGAEDDWIAGVGWEGRIKTIIMIYGRKVYGGEEGGGGCVAVRCC